ncbi:hypothetical protein PHYPSEUDO_006276 [Phytophthora pseudosyringae]|uniref:Uncharacterized protein n=1 Tax=Phytophthora pseudosyringae TaxID=221518 RepID=A0A8T1VJ59_9STRA|nr:hypothetical protein PHYPSEUDO_006276 [Phytophthora pseudosyringae]
MAPLLTVALVLRSRPAIASIDHVPNTVSAFLDSSVQLPLHRGCQFNSLTLLGRIWDSDVDLEQVVSPSWSIRSLLRSEKRYQEFQFSLTLIAAVKRQNLEMAQWIFDHFPVLKVNQHVVQEAAKAGALRILQYFLDNDIDAMDEETGQEKSKSEGPKRRKIHWGGCDAANAARAGHGNVVKWLYEETQSGARADEETMKAAVGSGDIELVKSLKEKLDLWPAEGVQEAAVNGHFEMLKWMHENGHYDDEVSAGTLLKAAEKGHVDSDGNDDGYVFGEIFHITSVGRGSESCYPQRCDQWACGDRQVSL